MLIPKVVEELRQARNVLRLFSQEKIAFVRKCLDDVNVEISRCMMEDELEVEPRMDEIRIGYEIDAEMDGIMTYDEFNTIYDALDTLDIEKAMVYA